MVRETRHLWVGNLPDNIREDRIREHFKRYGRVQNVKLLGRAESASAGVGATGASGVCATVAFMDIKSASKAHNAEHVLDERTLTTEYYEPAAIPSTAGAPSAGSSPAGSGYSGSSSSVNSVPAPSSASRYHLSGGEDSSGATTCPLAASAAAPATWRGTNDSATDYCRRGNTPAAYGRYQRNNITAPYSTPPSNFERTTPHHRWYVGGGGGSGATGGESTPSTPGGCTESGRRRRLSGSASSRSDSSSPEPSDTSRASTPATQPPLSHHSNHRTPPAVSHQWASTSNGRPLSICVRNLPTRSTDSSLKDGLYHEYKKHGKVVWVKVVGQNADRYAIVRFKKPSDVEKALEVSQDKLFFGCKISVAPHQSCDDDADSTKPYETDIDEYHPKATRTLFIGNLEKDVTQQQLRDKFKHFGRIIEIDIKKGSGGGAGYAFCQYASISSVVEAIRAMDGEYVGGSRVKLGFGKPVATACVWVDGLTEHTEKQVLGAVSRCGAATSVCVDRAAGAALVHFEQAAAAGAAVRELRRVAAAASAAEPAHPRLCVDYASRECQEAFYEQLEKHGGSAALAGSERLSGGELTTRYVPSTRHDSIRYEGCGSRSRASSYGRSSSRTPRYSALEHYDPVDYAADRRYRVYDETGASSPLEDSPFEDRLQSVVVSPHRARRHCRDSSTEDRKHSKERRRSAGGGGGVRRSRSGSAGRERHTARRKHRRRHDGSGSRAGTPLRDEPDAPPAEPRRPPRDRPPLPMCLPLPKFAAQLLRTAPPAPHPAPQPTSAPDSPPRPPSVSSSSGGSAPHSPSLEERIRSLDEKYEKWSGSRAITDAPDRARLRHRLLEVDINEVKPSEVVSALLAKRSVFDEDSERLECVVRAPSPPDGQGRGAAQRVPRFPPLPTQPPPTCAAYSVPHHVTLEVDASDRPCDPRLNRPERPCRLEKLGKINESDYGECRLRPRTPSTDRSQPDSCDRRTPPALVDGDAESRSRDSASGTCDAESKSSFDMDDKEIDLGIKRERSNSSTSDSLLTGKSEATSANALLQNTNDVSHENKRPDDSQHFHLDQKCARDVIDMIIKKVESGQKFELQSDVPCKVPNEESKFEFLKQGEPCPLLDSETKIAICEGIRKSENNKIQTFNQSLTNKDSVEYELHLHHNHLASTINKEKDVINSVVNNCSDKNDKEHNISQLYQITKPEKENIQMEKKLEKEKQSCNSDTPPADKKLLITDKNVESRGVRSDRDKAKHNKERLIKDKHDCEKEKLKNYRNEKHMERNEKDRSLKDDCSIERKHIDKIDKSKVEKDTEKLYKEKTETDKSKNFDDKSRHDHHKKDKPEKDKRKDSDLGLLHSKSKKDERHKSEKQKKDVDIKRENKKEIEHIKTRKLSRDESSKEVSRKDSTDSSTSRASHESAKSKDLDNHDNKEDIKPKVKLTDLFFKLEADKGFSDSKEVKVEHSTIKIKSEIKEEKCVIGAMLEPHMKPKAEIIEKHRHHSLDSPSVDSKRKERLNSCSSLPSNIGHKRRISSHDSFDSTSEEAKKIKNEHKMPDRRDSKDSRSGDKHKATKFSKGHFAKIIESKTKDDKKGQVKPLDEAALLEFKENNDTKNSSIKGPKKLPKEDNNENIIENNEEAHNNLDFLALFELRSSEEDERQKALRKEMKEKKRIQQLQQIQELQMQQDAMQQGELLGKIKDDKKQKSEDKKKDAAREKRFSIDRKSREEKIDNNKKKNRKLVQSSDTSDSDEPKKHSIFDIIDDGPTYISMYDKVKARSCKNMQKQEEEKRQEKIKAKFSQLKQSRAKREEKKRSSWDEDSDSEHEVRKTQKSSLDNSSDEEEIHDKRRDKLQMANLDFDDNRTEEYFSTPNDDDLRNKLARKNSRSRIMSDSSGDDTSKSKSPHYHNDAKKFNMSDLDSLETDKIDGAKDLDDQIKKSSLLHLFGKSDSDDSKLKSNIDDDGTYKLPSFKPMCNDLSSESESVTSNRNVSEFRRKHKKKPKKYKSTFSDEENKINHTDSGIGDGENRHKMTEKQRRHSSKKDKRREKNRESIDTDEGGRDDKLKSRREKRSPDNVIAFEYGPDVVSNTTKRDGKMEDIFGPLSDESDKDTELQSKSEFPCYDFDFIKDKFNSTELKLKEKDDFKRKKEKKRKEKRWLREDDNSLDMDAVSKAIEARLFAESFTDDETRIRMEAPHENMRGENNEDDKYMDSVSLNEVVKFNNKHDKLRRDSREKKKKKKRNKEERQNRKEQNPFYHNMESLQKSDNEMTERPTLETMTNTMLLDIPLPNDSQAVDEKTDEGKSLEESPSLPRLTESPPILIQSIHDVETKSGASSSSSNILGDNDNNIYLESKSIEIEQIPMPPPFENIVQDISEVPLPTDPEPTSLSAIKSNSFIATLSSDSDLSEDAVQSLSVMETDIDKTVKINTTQEIPGDRIDATPSKVEKKVEEKPRAIISQEETEDAVAALLGESFGGKINIFSNYEEAENNAAHQNDSESTSLSTANIPEEDAEEMRQAVQNLNACEMELKPDTPVSDNDLLLIDTDNEETDEIPQDSSEKIPINIVAAHVPLINSVEKAKTAEEPQIHVSKPSIESNSTKAHLEGVNKSNDKDIKIKLPRRENVHLITSTATPVITSWTLTNNKILEPHVINIQPNIPHVKDKIEGKTTHITTNIVQIKTSQNQNLQINNIVKPVTPTRVSAPYQVIGQMVRPQVSNMQPPTIKIPEPHILYQKSQGIVVSPRMANDPRMQSPKASPQSDGMTSPRLPTIPVLSSSPQNPNSSGLVSPNLIHQRSPGQVTVVRVQQPPLSPIQAMHLTPGARTMVSPSRPNSVLVQTQRSPHHHSRLPVTPLLTPIPKQINIGTVLHQPNKGIAGNNNPPLLTQQKIITGDVRRNDLRNMSESKDNSKIILPASTSLQHSTNPTVMAQNRLISMQNAVHIGNINSSLHINNKFVINKMTSLNEKRENIHQKVTDHGSRQVPFVSSPIIHVAGVNHSTPSIIQSGTKQAMCNLQEASNISRGQASNVIHTLNSQRLLTPASISNVRHLEMNKVSPSVLAMATIRPSTVLTKLESTNISTVTTSNVTNVQTPILIKSSPAIGTIRLSSKPEKDNVLINTSVLQKETNKIEKELSSAADGNNLIKQAAFTLNTMQNSSEEVAKCETDFEELLKDNTNKIIITKDSDKKIEGNVEKTTTLLSKQSHDKPHIPNNEYSFQVKEQEVPTTDPTALEFSSFERKDDMKNEFDDLNKTNNLIEPSEETLSKENTSQLINVKQSSKDNTTKENLQLHKDKSFSPMLGTLLDKAYENVSIEKNVITSLDITKIDKTDDFPKESPNLSEMIENQLKTLDENDSWSAKDLNIESVIKKVDSLCNESIESFQTSRESQESENPVKVKSAPELVTETTILEEHSDHVNIDNTEDSPSENIAHNANLNTYVNVSTPKRGGRSIRAKKSEKNQDRVQTRQIAKAPRGGATAKRGRGRAKVDKKVKNLVTCNTTTIPGDVYDFHEDSGDEGSNKAEPRPRLILTIKSPISGQVGVTATSTLSIAQKEQNKFEERRPSRDDKLEDFVSPSPNTRKSRRLQEKDVHRSATDDIGEDGARNSRSAKRRPIRQAVAGKPTNCEKTDKALAADTRKSPRGTKRTRDRSLSDASIDSGDGDGRRDEITREPKAPRIEEPVAPPADPEPSIALRSASSLSVAPSLTSNAISSHVPPTIPTTAALNPVSSIVPEPAPPVDPLVAVSIAPKLVVPNSSAILVSTSPMIAVSTSPTTQTIAVSISSTNAVAVPPSVTTSSSSLLAPSVAQPVIPPVVPLSVPPVIPIVPSLAAPPPAPTPITKPPKKMISEISAKLAGAFEASGQHRPAAEPPAGAPGEAQLGEARRPGDNVPCAMLPVGATEAADARVQSPALPHRPPVAQRVVVDRATPILIRGGEGEAGAMGALGAMGAAGAGGARYRALVAGSGGPASLPRGAHHPPPDPPPLAAAHHQPPAPLHHRAHPGAASRITSVPSISPQGQMALGEGMYPHFSQQHFQMYQQHFRATQHERATPSPYTRIEAEGTEAPTSPLELRRISARVPRPAHSPSPADRHIMYAVVCGRSPPPAHGGLARAAGALPPGGAPGPPHASQVPHEADSLQMLLRRYPVMWQGLLALKNDSAAVQMHFVGGNPGVASETLARPPDLVTPMLRIAQRMRLEPMQLDQVHRKMKLENEHCILLALPCGRDHMDVLQQSTNLSAGFITYLQRKTAAGIVNIAPPGHQQAMFTVHVFPSCDFANENLSRIAPDLMHRVANIAHLLIVIATV